MTDRRFNADIKPAVFLLVHANMVAIAWIDGSCGAVGKAVAQEISFQNFPELLHTPRANQELHAGAVTEASITVLTEQPHCCHPHLRHLLQRNPDPKTLRKHRIRGQTTTHIHVESRAKFWVNSANKRQILNLVRHVLARRPRNSRLKLARKIMKLLPVQPLLREFFNCWGGVNNLIRRHACNRGAKNHARNIAAAQESRQANGIQLLPNRRHILNLNPMQLHVLAIREVRSAPRILLGNLTDRAQLFRGHHATIETNTQHKVLILQLGVGHSAGELAAQVLLTLRIQAHPLKPGRKIFYGNRIKTLL